MTHSIVTFIIMTLNGITLKNFTKQNASVATAFYIMTHNITNLYNHNLQIFVLSYSVFPLQEFTA